MYLKKKNGQVRNYQEDGVVPSGKTTLTDEELRQKYGKAYDFLGMEDNANRQQRVGSLAGMMDNDMYDMILGLSPEKAAEFMKAAKNYQYSPRIYNQKTDGDHRVGKVNALNREIDEDKLAKEFGKLKKKNYKGHAYDLNLFREIFGNENLTSEQADIMSQQMGTGPMTDALMSINPELDPGNSGGAYRQRFGSQSQEGFNRFPNAPQEYINNMLASGMLTQNEDGTYRGGAGDPGQDWLNIQNIAGGNDKNITKNQIINNLSSQNDLITEGQFPNNKWNPGRSSLGREAAFEFGVSQNKDGSFYSKGLNRNLDEKETSKLKNELANNYYDNSGFQLYKSEIGLDNITPGEVPSTKINNQLGPMPAFIPGDQMGDPTNEIEGVISLNSIQPGALSVSNNQAGTVINPNESQEDTRKGTVNIDFPEINNTGGGEDTGGGSGTLNDASNKNGEGKSISAVTQSWKNRTHIGTGEGYNEGDLDRDAKIIKDTYGDDAYNKLLSEINNMAKPIANNNATVVEKSNQEDSNSDNKGFTVNKKKEEDQDTNYEGESEIEIDDDDDESPSNREDETAGFIDLSNFSGSDIGMGAGVPSISTFFKEGGFQDMGNSEKREQKDLLKKKINNFKENMDPESEEDKKALELLEEELDLLSKIKFGR